MHFLDLPKKLNHIIADISTVLGQDMENKIVGGREGGGRVYKEGSAYNRYRCIKAAK